MIEFMSTHAASVYVLRRDADAKSLLAGRKKTPNAWDFGYARVLFLENHVIRVVNRQGLTVAEATRPSMNQVLAMLLKEWWA